MESQLFKILYIYLNILSLKKRVNIKLFSYFFSKKKKKKQMSI
jgi:hypothetical protein